MATKTNLPPSARLLHLWPDKDIQDYVAAQGLGSLRPLWTPNPDHGPDLPNPQRLAYESKADILGYGGAAGGGKSSLLLGLAFTQHQRSAIFRRIFPNLRGLIDESKSLIEGYQLQNEAIISARGLPKGSPQPAKGTYNESLHRWTMADGRVVEFESCQYEGDKEKQRGRPRDLYCFDEATEFSQTQVEFITAWNRSTNPKQRTRIVLTFNPPADEGAGGWVIQYFLPWVSLLFPQAYAHPRPAAPGELRWYASMDGKSVEVDDGTPFTHRGQLIRPLSRTFIPASLRDNPHLWGTNYEALLQALPEPLRSQLLFGDFGVRHGANPFQIIPTASVRAAQARWTGEPAVPPDVVGVDVARGGKDKTVFAPRWGNTYGVPHTFPGIETSDSGAVAALFQALYPAVGRINVDVIGVGSAVYDALRSIYGDIVHPINVGFGSTYTDRSGRLRMMNLRAEMLWRMRDLLDTVDDVALPPGNGIVADLCAANYHVRVGGKVLAEDKDGIKRRLGRSPDEGDAILLAMYDPAEQMPVTWQELMELQGAVQQDLGDMKTFWR